MLNEIIEKQVYNVGAQDKERKVFDELIPLPEGTSYNSYLVIGKKKIALIDSVDPTKLKEIIENFKSLNINTIDYIISNHAEQDHSGSIPKLLENFPMAKIVTNNLCKNMLKDLLLIKEEDFIVVKENDILELGDKTVKFISTPWVHWPETMVSYLIEDKILFSCDMFGSHLAFEKLLTSENKDFEKAFKRYYAEIMMPYRKNVLINLEKIKMLELKLIAPSHGPIHDNPKNAMHLYEEWSIDRVEKKAIIVYVSMHGSTKKAVEILSNKLNDLKFKNKVFNLSVADIGEIAIELVDASTIILATPTFITGAHPLMIFGAHVINSLKPKTKFVSIINSYGWHGKVYEQIKGIFNNLNSEFFNPVDIKGYPKDDDIFKLETLAKEIKEKNILI